MREFIVDYLQRFPQQESEKREREERKNDQFRLLRDFSFGAGALFKGSDRTAVDGGPISYPIAGHITSFVRALFTSQ